LIKIVYFWNNRRISNIFFSGKANFRKSGGWQGVSKYILYGGEIITISQ